MRREYKSPNKKKSNGKSSPLFVGLLVGLLIGVVLSVVLTLYIKGSPFSETSNPEDSIKPLADKKTDTKPSQENKPAKDQAEQAGENGKPRFDFYKILPSSETAISEDDIKKNEQQTDQANQIVNFYLQVGAFQTEQDADNMKANLALLGLESVIQTASLPDKGIWHRVRVGPFTELSQTERAKEVLKQNGLNADLIKVKIDATNQ